MPETREAAKKRAKEAGIPVGNVICLDGDDNCYIAPTGITKTKAKRAYAEMRDDGYSAELAAKIAHKIQGESN